MRQPFRRIADATAAVAALCLAPACEHIPSQGGGYVLKTVGSMHATIMGGERDAKIDLKTLSNKPNLYAVGPMAGLSGEITVIDSRPSLATVGMAGKIQIEASFDSGAPFLVWAEVGGWEKEMLPGSIQSISDLEAYLTERATDKSLTDAFPFLVSGLVEDIGYHVLNADPTLPHPAGMGSHKDIQVHFSSGPVEATLVGFYSTTHQGVFTHKGSLTHLHFQTADNTQSGHVETVKFGSGSFTLALPK